MQHPSLIARAVGSTLLDLRQTRITREEAELDLIELIATQIMGKTDYAVAMIGFYVRAVMKALAERQITLDQAFETFVDAAITAGEGDIPVSTRLAKALANARVQPRRFDQGARSLSR